MFYIIGLGNPGKEYDGTRHNIGRDILTTLAEVEGFSGWEKNKSARALYTRGNIAGEAVEFFLPETFMNKSGETVQYITAKQEATPDMFVVVYDDVALPLGEIKLSIGRGDGGHNGIKSITQALKSKEFIRVRVGVATRSFWTGKTVRPQGSKMGTHVMGKFTKGERKTLEKVAITVHEAIISVVTNGITSAMNTYN